jgi:hypothetical protein
MAHERALNFSNSLKVIAHSPLVSYQIIISIFQKQSVWETAASGLWLFNDQCDKMIVWGTMEAGKNSVICMGLILGPNKTGEICGKMMVMGTMHRGSTLCVCVCARERASLSVETTRCLPSDVPGNPRKLYYSIKSAWLQSLLICGLVF